MDSVTTEFTLLWISFQSGPLHMSSRINSMRIDEYYLHEIDRFHWSCQIQIWIIIKCGFHVSNAFKYSCVVCALTRQRLKNKQRLHAWSMCVRALVNSTMWIRNDKAQNSHTKNVIISQVISISHQSIESIANEIIKESIWVAQKVH